MEMTRRNALIIIDEIRNGMGAERDSFPESMRGSIAKKLWNDGAFSLGFEYGLIQGLMKAFGLSPDDLLKQVSNHEMLDEILKEKGE